MTDVVERRLRKSLLRGPCGSNGFAIPSASSCIDRRKAVPVPARSDQSVDDVCIGSDSAGPQEIDRLYCAFAQVTPDNYPRTARLLASGTRRTAQKVIEEAGEVALEAVKHSRHGIISESADLLYHLVALWHRAGIHPGDVWTEMHRRAEWLGIAEKLPKSRNRDLKRDRSMQAVAARRTVNTK